LETLQGSFLPDQDPRKSGAACVVGVKLAAELFGAASPVGQWVRVADRKFRVVGLLTTWGQSIGVDFDDAALIPIGAYQQLFDSYSLFRILVEVRSKEEMKAGTREIQRILQTRHEGEDDVTVIAQDSVIGSFNKIFTALTLGLGVIAAVSLLMAGVLTMNVMLVSVTQRTAEIGLLKALGGASGQIFRLFLYEAGIVSLIGAMVGTGAGFLVTALVRYLFPAFPFAPPLWAVLAGVAIALGNGLLFGVWPAIRAAKLDPVAALAKR
jgi:putative ABC transport system permease protein